MSLNCVRCGCFTGRMDHHEQLCRSCVRHLLSHCSRCGKQLRKGPRKTLGTLRPACESCFKSHRAERFRLSKGRRLELAKREELEECAKPST